MSTVPLEPSPLQHDLRDPASAATRALHNTVAEASSSLATAPCADAPTPDPLEVAETELGRIMATASVPLAHGAPGLGTDAGVFPLDSSLERAVLAEACCRVSMNAFMAMPGPSMSGELVAHLGDDALKERYYGALLERPTWTFFAMTEPDHGSDVTAMETRAEAVPGGVQLSGTKCFIGNAARARMGVVFARTGRGLFSIEAYLTWTDRPGMTATPMSAIAVTGAEFCRVRFENHPVPATDLLGRHVPRSQRGVAGGVRVFHTLRPVVAAMSLGVGECALDELADDLGTGAPVRRRDELAALTTRADSVRELVRVAALAADGGDGSLAAAAKESAHRFARDATAHVANTLGMAGLLARPRALLALSNAWAIQFMEGTVDVQRQQVFHALNTSATPSHWSAPHLVPPSAVGHPALTGGPQADSDTTPHPFGG